MEAYAGKQFVGIDLHRRRTVIVRITEGGEVLKVVRINTHILQSRIRLELGGWCSTGSTGLE